MTMVALGETAGYPSGVMVATKPIVFSCMSFFIVVVSIFFILSLFAIAEFTDVLGAIGSGVDAITIVIVLALIFRTCGQSYTLCCGKQKHRKSQAQNGRQFYHMSIMTEKGGERRVWVEFSSGNLLSNKPRHSLTLRTTHDVTLIS